MITLKEVKDNPSVKAYIQKADESLIALGYTEHSFAHVGKVSDKAAEILKTLGYSSHEVELAAIAGWLHDIGNIVNRIEHAQSGAVMAFRLLDNMGTDPQDTATIITAIGNHDEGTGEAVSPIAAALILADKTDVRRSRVRNDDIANFDIHDRVNYSVTDATAQVSDDHRSFVLNMSIDTEYCSVMDYFEIFLARMMLCRKAAEKLGMKFRIIINGQSIL